MISGGLAGGGTVAENVDEILDISEELLENIYNYGVFEIWKRNINSILYAYPDIVDQPNQEFNTWTKHASYYGEMCEGMEYGRIKGLAGYLILYFTYLNLLLLVV